MAPVHSGIKRRHFLRVLGAAAVAMAAAPLAAANEFVRPEVVVSEALAFYKGAFAAVTAVPRAFVSVDVIHGWKVVRPELAARVTG